MRFIAEQWIPTKFDDAQYFRVRILMRDSILLFVNCVRDDLIVLRKINIRKCYNTMQPCGPFISLIAAKCLHLSVRYCP